jgi:hypothetical protein
LATGSVVFDYTSNPPIGGGAIVLDAFAAIDPYIATGGAITGGLAFEDSTFSVQTSGGAIAGGLALQRSLIPIGGGVIAGGVALDSKRFDEVGSGGAVILVAALEETAIITPFLEIGSGGAIVQPLGFIDPYIPEGGALASGTARVTQNYDTNLNPNEFQVVARGEYFVPVHATTAAIVCSFTFNPVDNRLGWYIEHDFGSQMDLVRVRKNEIGEGAGPVVISIDGSQDVTVSPIEGSALLGPVQAADHTNGIHWIQLQTNGQADRMRAQMIPFSSALAGGETAFFFSEAGIGGSIASGSADVSYTSNTIASGGSLASGRAQTSINVAVGGGVICGGLVLPEFGFFVIGDGGGIVSGLAVDEAIYTLTGIGGAIAAGRATPGIAPKIGGGAITGGLLADTPYIQYISNPVILGGGITGGKARQTFIDQVIVIASVAVGGQSLPAKIIFYNTQRNGYGRAMASDNILTNIPDDTVRLIPPTNDVSPELKESRFRIQHNPGWCEVPVKCEEGVLPEVIVKRQKGIVPPKIRQDTPRSGGIVSAL